MHLKWDRRSNQIVPQTSRSYRFKNWIRRVWPILAPGIFTTESIDACTDVRDCGLLRRELGRLENTLLRKTETQNQESPIQSTWKEIDASWKKFSWKPRFVQYYAYWGFLRETDAITSGANSMGHASEADFSSQRRDEGTFQSPDTKTNERRQIDAEIATLGIWL